MGIIKPTLTLTANASSATASAGPMSMALSLSATDSLDVTKVESMILDVDASHGATNLFLDASNYTAAGANVTEGVDGGFVYLKNLLVDNNPVDALHDIMIGATAAELDADVDATSPSAVRLMTLKPGEFAWMPWDMTYDIYFDAKETNTSALECWVFVRTGTA
tara:strand:- start:79 stop:570 length:492 start_codon:yes stop_codon:yes gene_type:complete